MNTYVVALVAVLGAFGVGALWYGVLFKGQLKSHEPKHDPLHIAVSSLAMYGAAVAFTILYQDVFFESPITGVLKGFYLSLIVGIGLFALPFFADSGWLKSKATWPIISNWVVSFVAMGVIVGLLLP
jgi:hypothetical protein